MNKVIQLLKSTKIKQEEAMRQLPKMVDEHVATIAVEEEQFIKEIDQALNILCTELIQELIEIREKLLDAINERDLIATSFAINNLDTLIHKISKNEQ